MSLLWKAIWRPQRGPQEALLACPIPDVFYGGARGSGKSDALLGDFAAHAGRHASAARGILFRRTYPEIEEIERRSREIYSPLRAVYNAGTRTWLFPDGATLKLRHLDRDEHADEYQGHQYTWMGFDELQSWPSSAPIDRLWATLRSPHGVPCLRRSTGNPGGPGHQWVRRRYVDPAIPGTPFSYRPQPTVALEIQAVFIPARLEDNPALIQRDPQYEGRLAAVGNAELYRAWRFGDWNVIAGAALELNAAVHLVPPVEVPPHWIWFGAFDWGYAHPWVFCAYAVDEDATVFQVDAISGRRMQPREIAERIRERFDVSLFRYIVAGHDCWADYRARTENVPTIAEVLIDYGIYLTNANISRVQGLNNVRRYLEHGPDRAPTLRFFDTPANRKCFAQLAAMVLNPTDLEDVLKVDADPETGEGGDDWYDCVRYGIGSRPWKAPDPNRDAPFSMWSPETLAAEHERLAGRTAANCSPGTASRATASRWRRRRGPRSRPSTGEVTSSGSSPSSHLRSPRSGGRGPRSRSRRSRARASGQSSTSPGQTSTS